MPKEEQTISIQAIDTDTALSIAYEAFKNLEWRPKYAGPDKLLAITDGGYKTAGQQVIISVAGSQLVVISDILNRTDFDVGNRNKKNVNAFIAAFQTLENSISEETIEANRQDINIIRERTQQTAEEDAIQSAELEKVMHLSQRNLAVTYGIMIINVLVFAAMAISGVSLFEPNGYDIINWGGNYGPFTLSGDWWRLITCVFVHIGIIHIAFNMYALYMIGIYLEPMLGKVRYAVAYLCTGVLASLASLWWHLNNPSSSAGASGAIFGMYGVFLALLSTSLIPKKVRGALLKSIGIFVVYNLVFGISSGIDNAAHIGGLLSGLLIGYAYYFTLKKEFSAKSIVVVSTIIIAATIGGTYLFLENIQTPSNTEVGEIRRSIEEAKLPDTEKFNTNYNEVIRLQDEALAVFKNPTIKTDQQLGDSIYVISKPKWKEAEMLASEMVYYKVSDRMKHKAEVLLKYIRQRREEVEIIRRIGRGTQLSKGSLDSIRTEINITVDSLKKL